MLLGCQAIGPQGLLAFKRKKINVFFYSERKAQEESFTVIVDMTIMLIPQIKKKVISLEDCILICSFIFTDKRVVCVPLHLLQKQTF